MLLLIRLLVSGLIILLSYNALASSPDIALQVTYPEVVPGSSENQANTQYLESLLKLALHKSGYKVNMRGVSVGSVSERRSHNYLRAKRYNVHWLMSSPLHEKELIPIKVPLFKGLIGWRIFFIRKGDEKQFETLEGLEQLKQLLAGVAHDWPDKGIMQRIGFNVMPMYSNQGRFDFLNRGRSDYISRSMIEIWNEEPEAVQSKVVVEKTLALHYPAAYYFFVSPGEDELASAIRMGLYTAINDGDFELLFKERFMKDIIKSDIKRRRVFEIENRLFIKSNELQNNELWFDPNNY